MISDIALRPLINMPYSNAMHASTQHATKFKLCTETFLSVPRSAVIDGIISYGGSTGIGVSLPCKAYSEFFERNHLFTAVPLDCRQSLVDINSPAFREKLLSLCHYDDKKACLNHVFSFTEVSRLFDESKQLYFYNAISLNGDKADAAFLNFCDSCACAAHPVKEQAIYHSLMEFLERQSLLGSWMSRRYQFAINPAVLKEVTPYQDLVNQLLENGEIHIFANGNELPGHTVIMFYFSHAENDLVQYSVGSSSGLSLQEALISSLEELYQCYTFLYNMESSSTGLEHKAGSGYHVAFQQYNQQDTKKLIPFLQSKADIRINHVNDFANQHCYTLEEILSKLKEISSDIYYYHYYEKALNIHITKILSPDFFAHMSVKKTHNFNNAYARKLSITKENAYLQKIPFP